ncbi:uncharacterized protein LOC142340037 [Convolutriloba macropyga]|uniref:uncharacterized protein LOC142340037 n=1 Tax=Convolutriloba macropyga TaxID=536237 RepID=UPI003F5228A2
MENSLILTQKFDHSHQNVPLLLNCDWNKCNCSFFVAQVTTSRFCANCGHSWFYHAVNKIKNCDQNQEIKLEVVFNLASLVLYATTAIPINLKILLDRLLSKLLHSEVLQIIYALGWLYEDYVRGYKFFNQSLSQLDSWKTVSKKEEFEIVRLFLSFPETKSIAAKVLISLNLSENENLSPIGSAKLENRTAKLCEQPSITKQTVKNVDDQKSKVSLNSVKINTDINVVLSREIPRNVGKKQSLRFYKCFQCAQRFRTLRSMKIHRRTCRALSNKKPIHLTEKSNLTSGHKNVKKDYAESLKVEQNGETLMQHGENCRCKKCKYLACNLFKKKEEEKMSTCSTQAEENSPMILQKSDFSGSCNQENISVEKYLNFDVETNALQELKSLEALVSSVDVDFNGGDEQKELDLKNLATDLSKCDSDNYESDENSFCDGSCDLRDEIGIGNDSNSEKWITFQAGSMNKQSEKIGKGSAKYRSDIITHGKESKQSKLDETETGKNQVLKSEISKVVEKISSEKTVPLASQMSLEHGLSWSELKNCSNTVREKLDTLFRKPVDQKCYRGVNKKQEKSTCQTGSEKPMRGSIRSLLSCKCPKCGKVFSSPASMRVHFKNVHIREMHKCLVPGCNSLFNSVRSRNRHSMNANLHQRKSAHIHFL